MSVLALTRSSSMRAIPLEDSPLEHWNDAVATPAGGVQQGGHQPHQPAHHRMGAWVRDRAPPRPPERSRLRHSRQRVQAYGWVSLRAHLRRGRVGEERDRCRRLRDHDTSPNRRVARTATVPRCRPGRHSDPGALDPRPGEGRRVPRDEDPPRGAIGLNTRTRGLLYGLAAAVAFGVGAPLAKRLLGQIEPVMLAGLLYLGAFWALAGTSVAHRTTVETRFKRTDVSRLVALVVIGGVVAPVLLLVGLD